MGELAYRSQVFEAAQRLRVQIEAREIVEAERHARSWRPPADYGTMRDELALPDDGPRWRVEGLLGAGHNAVLVASRKAGKTTMVNSLVGSLVDGYSFLGRFAPTAAAGSVAILNYEVDARQYRRWMREVGIANTHKIHALHLRGSTLPLAHPRVRGWLVEWLERRRVEVLIIDPYSRAYVGSVRNGNDEAEVGAFLDNLDTIKADAGVNELVMAVHTPKAKAEAGEETAIGSQRLEGWPDALWYLTRDQVTGYRFLRAEGRDVAVEEQQLTYHPPDRSLVLGGGSRAESKRRADTDRLVEYVREHPDCTGNDIKAGLGWGRDRVATAVAAALAGHHIQVTEGKGRATHHRVVDLTWSESPDRSRPSDQSGGLVYIETTTGPPPPQQDQTTPPEGAEPAVSPPSCPGCGRPLMHPRSIEAGRCERCRTDADQTAARSTGGNG